MTFQLLYDYIAGSEKCIFLNGKLEVNLSDLLMEHIHPSKLNSTCQSPTS